MPRLTREENRQLTRERLLDAASRCFAERGFHGTTVEAVVSRSGYSRGAFYSNFSSMDELFLELLEQRMESEATEIGTLVAESTSGAHLVTLLHERRVTTPDDPMWWMLLDEFRLHALRDRELRPRLAAREQRLRALYRKAVEHVVTTTGIEIELDLDLLALVVQVLEDGIAYHRQLEPDAVASGTFVDAINLLVEAVTAMAERTAAPS